MNSAKNKHTGEIVSAAALTKMPYVDTEAYICPGCEVKVSPCSYKEANKPNPYFRMKPNKHKTECDLYGIEKLKQKARTERVDFKREEWSTIRASIPSKLVLKDERPVTDSNAEESTGKNKYRNSKNSSSQGNSLVQRSRMTKHPFSDFIANNITKHGEETWITVYKDSGAGHNRGHSLHCALVKQEKTDSCMDSYGWELTKGSDTPGFAISHKNGEEIITYCNEVNNPNNPLLRLVFVRDFEDRKKSYLEILEEFRLFHNLFFNQDKSTYIKFDENGDEVEVIKIGIEEVKIRKNSLESFMAAKQMNLLLYFQWERSFECLGDFSEQQKTFSEDHKTKSLVYSIWSSQYYFSLPRSTHIVGKKLIQCKALETCGIWPFEPEQKYLNFIIDDDSTTFTCNPDELANYFGKNPDAPYYLTPVFFKNEVMQKYYASPSIYTIEDGRLCSKMGLWILKLDNHSTDHVSVFLGDLGRYLPEKEQYHLLSFNIPPNGAGISKTCWERSFQGNFCNSVNPALLFKQVFEVFCDFWQSKFGFDLFLPLTKEDIHNSDSIRSMLSNEQKEFDDQILGITKVLIDSINIKENRE